MTRRRMDRIIFILCTLLFAGSSRALLHAAEPPGDPNSPAEFGVTHDADAILPLTCKKANWFSNAPRQCAGDPFSSAPAPAVSGAGQSTRPR